MFVKLVVVACTVAVSYAAWQGPLAGGQPASLYPAGISPQACPNFPNCENPAVALGASDPSHPTAQGYSAPPPAWNGGNAGQPAPSWNAAPQAYQAPAPAWNQQPAPAWNQAQSGQYNGGNQEALDKGEYTGDGDYRGEGLAESGAFGPAQQQNAQAYQQPAPAYQNYQQPAQAYQNYQQQPAQAYQGPAGHGAPAAAVPAGVDPSSCPNYPYCQ